MAIASLCITLRIKYTSAYSYFKIEIRREESRFPVTRKREREKERQGDRESRKSTTRFIENVCRHVCDNKVSGYLQTVCG